MARILVIKLGALGDLVLAMAPFAAIRAHHLGDQITLLTTAPFAAFCAASPWFDRVVVDRRPAWWNLAGLAGLARMLRGFDFVYDLQTSGRSSRYFRLAGSPGWSGIAHGCSHPHDNPQRDAMHTIERHTDQLARAGIAGVPRPDLGWLAGGGPVIAPPYAVLVPGAAPHRPAKRWPAAHFGALAADLSRRGIRPVVVGASCDRALADDIRTICPEALDLTGGTSLVELAGLAARAAIAVGNDTGPMHLATAMGCRAIVLFSRESDPALTAPRGPDPAAIQVVRVDDLADLPPGRVVALLA